MGLKQKTDNDLVEEIQTFRGSEKELVAKILLYLREIEERQLFLARGYASLYAFCTECLGYSKDEAHIRIQAMRLLRTVPEVEAQIRSGHLSLSVAAQAQSAFRQENARRKYEARPGLSTQEKAQVLEALQTQSSRESKRTLATFFPKLDAIPEQTKPLDAARTLIQFTVDAPLMAKLERLKDLLAHKNFDGRWEGLISELADLALKTIEKTRPQELTANIKANATPDISVKANATGTGEMEARLKAKMNASEIAAKPKVTEKMETQVEMKASEKAVALASAHQRGAAVRGASVESKQKSQTPAHAGVQHKSSSGAQSSALGAQRGTQRRYIAIEVRRQVWRRAQEGCAYVDPQTGRKCGSKYALQIDHVLPLALGGTDAPANLRLLCAGHNQFLGRRVLRQMMFARR